MKKLLLLLLIATTLFAKPITYTKRDTCLIRHFKLYEYPSWVAKVTTRTGKDIYFSSPKSMFEYYFNPIKWTSLGAISSSDLTEVYVTDFNTLEKIDAKSAYYVYGSNIISPAGDDLIPFSSKIDAANFSKKSNGKRVLKFNEVKNSLIRLLNGRI